MTETALTEDAYAQYARDVGSNFHRRRVALNLSLSGAAAAAGVSPDTIRRIETGVSGDGEPAHPRLITLCAVAQGLETTLHEMLKRSPS